MSRLDLDAIEKRVKAARPGPWISSAEEMEGAWLFDATVWLPDGSMGVAIDGSVADAEFIAHARDNIPALLDEVARLNRLLGAA
jgi:hypothetical protein